MTRVISVFLQSSFLLSLFYFFSLPFIHLSWCDVAAFFDLIANDLVGSATGETIQRSFFIVKHFFKKTFILLRHHFYPASAPGANPLQHSVFSRPAPLKEIRLRHQNSAYIYKK